MDIQYQTRNRSNRTGSRITPSSTDHSPRGRNGPRNSVIGGKLNYVLQILNPPPAVLKTWDSLMLSVPVLKSNAGCQQPHIQIWSPSENGGYGLRLPSTLKATLSILNFLYRVAAQTLAGRRPYEAPPYRLLACSRLHIMRPPSPHCTITTSTHPKRPTCAHTEQNSKSHSTYQPHSARARILNRHRRN